ncbi:hypothetical protein ACHAQA_009622 [Verticillium albo-atrum]
MTFEQRKFSLVPDKLRPVSNASATEEVRRPMTSKQAKKLYLERNRGPRLTKQQQRQRERELQAEIRREIEEKEKAERQEKDRIRQQAKAKVVREKKKAKEDAEREVKRKAGLPLSTCRPSQDTIARFFRPNRAEKKPDSGGEKIVAADPKEEAGSDQNARQPGASSPDRSTSPNEDVKADRIEPGPIEHRLSPVVEEREEAADDEHADKQTEDERAADEETADGEVGTCLQDEQTNDVPDSPPRKRIRLEEAVEVNHHRSVSPPLVIHRTPSPEAGLSRISTPPAPTPVDNTDIIAGTSSANNQTGSIHDSAQDIVEASPSPPKLPGVGALNPGPSHDQMNPPGFIRASALHKTPNHTAAPRFVRPQHPSTYKTCQTSASNGPRKFLLPAQATSPCLASPSVPPPSSMLAFITNNIDDFSGGLSQLGPEDQSDKSFELQIKKTQVGQHTHTPKANQRGVQDKKPTERTRPVEIISPAADLLQELGDLDSLFPSGTQLQRELLEDEIQDSLSAGGARSDFSAKGRSPRKKRVGSGLGPEKPRNPHLALARAEAVETLPFFCSQDFNLSPQDVQEIEASATLPPDTFKVKSTKLHQNPVTTPATKSFAARPTNIVTKPPRVQQPPFEGRVYPAGSARKKPNVRADGPAQGRAPQNPTLPGHRPKAAAQPKHTSVASHEDTGVLQPTTNPSGPSRAPQDTVSSQDLAAMMEADWDDDCLSAKQQQQRDENEEPLDLWGAISSQDLRAVFDEDWGDLVV